MSKKIADKKFTNTNIKAKLFTYRKNILATNSALILANNDNYSKFKK